MLQRLALNFVDRTRRYPRKLRWACFDKDTFESLLSKLRALNDDMAIFLETSERKRYLQMQQETFMQVLQMNNRLDDLFALLNSLKTSEVGHMTECNGNNSEESLKSTYEERRIRLTRFKAVSIAIEKEVTHAQNSDAGASLILAEAAAGTELEFGMLSRTTPYGEDEQCQRSQAIYGGDTWVWIDWRYYEGVGDHLSPPSFITQRISKLTKLLRDEMKPAEFLVPDCLGYVLEPELFRFGFVYKSMESLGSDLPISLLELFTTHRKPSLTTRIRIASAIASSIWYLHATNWLHKGLRSENIIFQDRKQIRTAKPFLCGFDYSRPFGPDEVTELPSQDQLHELYRHPKTQFAVPRDGRSGLKKAYDIYSLGVVLFEIGVWKPISDVLRLDTTKRIKTANIKNVQANLLQDENLELLESEAGDVYAALVRMCLGGTLAPEQMLGSIEADNQLQLGLGQHVVEKLEGIAV